MENKYRRKRTSKLGTTQKPQYRDKQMILKLSQSEIDLIEALKKNRNLKSYHSRADVIMLAVKFAMGQLTITDLKL